MKKFILSVGCVSIFFIGLGAIVQTTGAKFKSDEKALALIARARIAIGGDAAIGSIQSLRIVGSTTRNVKADGATKSVTGQTEIAFQLPDKFMRTMMLGDHNASFTDATNVRKEISVVTSSGPLMFKREGDGTGVGAGAGSGAGAGVGIASANGPAMHVIIRNADGTTQELNGDEAKAWVESHQAQVHGANTQFVFKQADGTTVKTDGSAAAGANDNVIIRRIGGDGESGQPMTFKIDTDRSNTLPMTAAVRAMPRSNDFLRTTLSLLLTAPQGMDVEYTYGGDGSVDGVACDIVNASFGGQTYHLYLDKASSMPVAVGFKSGPAPMAVTLTRRVGDPATGQTVVLTPADAQKVTVPADGGDKQVNLTFTNDGAAPAQAGGNYTFRRIEGGPGASTDYMIKFSDFRSVNGIQLPYQWVQTGGDGDETFTVTSYDANSPDIAQKFQNQTVLVRTSKPDSNK